MFNFEDVLKNALPGGSVATPIAIAVGALVLGNMFGGSSSHATAPAAPAADDIPPDPTLPANPSSGSLIGGLGDLIGKLTAGGAASQVNSWVGTGANEPIHPGQLGGALGSDIVGQLAAKTGMNEQELLSALASALPQVINAMTPNGRLPTHAELGQG